MTRPIRMALALSAALLAGSGCRPPAPKPAAAAPRRFPLVGVVRSVDAAGGRVTIRHEAIPGFMEAMTMPFALEDRALLDELKPGDEVAGTLRVTADDSSLDDLSITRPALAPDPGSTGAGLPPPIRLLRPGDPVPDFAMTTQEGAPLRLSDLRGKVVALTFIYTRCPLPNYCPLMDKKFGQLAERLRALGPRADGARLLSVSFDPEHDTPDALAAHARLRGAAPPLWTFAVAPHAELARVAAPLGLFYAPMKDEVAHNLSTALIGPDGRLLRLATGPDAGSWSPADFLQEIRSSMAPPTR